MDEFVGARTVADVTIDDYNNERDLIIKSYRALRVLNPFSPLLALIELDGRREGFREQEMFSEVYPLPRESRFPILISHKKYRLDLEKAIRIANGCASRT